MMTAAAGVCVAAIAATGAQAACVDQTYDTVFSAFGDDAMYALVPGGDFETGAAGWTFTGDAAVVDEDTDSLGTGADLHALQLAPGASALSPPVCVTRAHRTMRFFARITGAGRARGSLVVDMVYPGGVAKTGVRATTTETWQPTAPLRLGIWMAGLRRDQETTVQFRFTAVGRSAVQVDDVYVDPRMR